ncbi:hypothetical protein Tco_1304633 [Tanacetum coccineum]
MANLRYSDKHNMVAFLKKPTESVGFNEIVDFLKGTSLRYALSHNLTIYDSLVKKFWQTATVRTLANEIQELVASIDNNEYTITEASIRSQLQLADATCATPDQGEGSAIPAGSQPTPDLVPSITEATTTTSGLDAGMDSGNIHESPLRSHEAPLHEGNTSGSAEDSLNLKELMDIIPKLVLRINNLEKELQQTKSTYGKAVLTLVERVKLPKAALKRKSMKVILSESEDEETEGQGRKIQDIDDDSSISLVRNSMKEKEIFAVKERLNSAEVEVNTKVNLGSAGVNTGNTQSKGRKSTNDSEDVQATQKTKEQIRQEEAGLAEAMRLQDYRMKRIARQVHLDALLAKRIQEEQELSEQQQKRKVEVQEASQFYTEED